MIPAEDQLRIVCYVISIGSFRILAIGVITREGVCWILLKIDMHQDSGCQPLSPRVNCVHGHRAAPRAHDVHYDISIGSIAT